jgi:DNA-binding transcriptional LysR family regulator
MGCCEGVKRSAEAGLGYAFLSHFAVADEVAAGRLESFRIEGRDPLRRTFDVVRLAGRDLTPAEDRFLSTLVRCCAKSSAFATACVVPGALR